MNGSSAGVTSSTTPQEDYRGISCDVMAAMFEDKTIFFLLETRFLVMQQYCIIPAYKHGRREIPLLVDSRLGPLLEHMD